MARDFASTSSQYLSTGTAVITATPISMACWFKVDNVTARHWLFSAVDNINAEGDRFAFNVRGDAGGDPLRGNIFQHSPGLVEQPYINGVTANTWHHAGLSKIASGNSNVYLNGIVGTPAAHVVTPAGINDVQIGGINYVSYTSYSDSSIAEAAMWNAVLTGDEFATLALGYSPLFVRPQSLIAYWITMGRTSPEIDIVGGYGASLNNGPTQVDHPPKIIYPWSVKYGMPSAALAAAIGPFPTHFRIP